jgi:hypothetical protein
MLDTFRLLSKDHSVVVSWDGEVDWVLLRPKQAAMGSVLQAERSISWAKGVYAAHYFRRETIAILMGGGFAPAI